MSAAAQGIDHARQGTSTEVDKAGYVLVAFFAIPFFLFNIMPVLFGFYVAFTRWSIVGSPKWEGLNNFTRAFKRWTNQSPRQYRQGLGLER